MPRSLLCPCFNIDGYRPHYHPSAFAFYSADYVPPNVTAETVEPAEAHRFAVLRPPTATRTLTETAELYGWRRAFRGAAVHLLRPNPRDSDDQFIILAGCSFTNAIKVDEAELKTLGDFLTLLREHFGLREQIYLDRTAPFSLDSSNLNYNPFRFIARDFSWDLRHPSEHFGSIKPFTADSVFADFAAVLARIHERRQASLLCSLGWVSNIVAAHNVSPHPDMSGYSPVQAIAAVTPAHAPRPF